MLISGDLVRSEHGRGGLRSGPREPTKYALLTSGGLALPVDPPRHNSQHVGQPEVIGATARCATLVIAAGRPVACASAVFNSRNPRYCSAVGFR